MKGTMEGDAQGPWKVTPLISAKWRRVASQLKDEGFIFLLFVLFHFLR